MKLTTLKRLYVDKDSYLSKKDSKLEMIVIKN